MRKSILLALGAGLALVTAVTACGDGKGDGQTGKAAEEAAESPLRQAEALDDGPRAAAAMQLDDELAARGEVLFEQKSCGDCHVMGEADIAPDLLGVMDRRTKPWLVRQITDPEWMSRHDPITRQLVAEFDMEMVDLGVAEAEVEPILQYLLREGRTGE